MLGAPPPPHTRLRERKKRINKCAGLSWDWVGGKKLFMCFFSGHSLWGEKINKIPPTIPENFVYVFFLYVQDFPRSYRAIPARPTPPPPGQTLSRVERRRLLRALIVKNLEKKKKTLGLISGTSWRTLSFLFFRPALSGGMDWWRMEWPFSRVRKIFFRGRNFQENALKFRRKSDFCQISGSEIEISEPKRMPYPH